MSDSECDSFVVEKSVEVLKKPQSSKRKTSTNNVNTSRATKKKPTPVDVFGLCGDIDASLLKQDPKALPSFIVNRVANGNQRRLAPTTGEFYVDVKVYARADAEGADKDVRWTKALLRMSCYLEESSSQWKLLQRFVKDANSLFEDSVPTYFSDSIKIKNQ